MAKQSKDSASAADAPKKKGGKLVLILGIVTVALAAGGGGAWYFTRPTDPNAQHAAPAAKPAVFLQLENFVVNIVAQDGQPQFLQAGLTLKLNDSAKVDLIKERMPEIRNRMLLVLSGKKAGDLLPVAGKHKLAIELANAVTDVLGPAAGIKAPKAAPVAVVSEAAAAPAPAGGEAPKAAAPAAPAAHPASADIEVLFTSFIIQ
jgi:flagellar FliL protein